VARPDAVGNERFVASAPYGEHGGNSYFDNRRPAGCQTERRRELVGRRSSMLSACKLVKDARGKGVAAISGGPLPSRIPVVVLAISAFKTNRTAGSGQRGERDQDAEEGGQ
jgi:hypothetical protein